MHTKSHMLKYIVVMLYRSVHIVSLAVYVLLACCQTVKEVVLKRRTVHARIMQNLISQDRLLLWTVIPGEHSYVICNIVLCQLVLLCPF